MKHVFYVLLVLIIIICWGGYSMKNAYKPASIENFNVSIQPCSILNNGKHEIADRALGNNRIKKYDPIDSVFDNEIEKCYINYDRKSGIADNFMGDKLCSMSEEYWQKQKASGLINNVYNSTDHVSSKYDNFNRCVVEINKNGINDDSLDGFWGEWGDQDKICARIDGNNAAILAEVKKVFFALIEENNAILKEISSVKNSLSQDYFSNGRVCADLKDSNYRGCMSKYHDENNILTIDISKKQKEYNDELSTVEIRIKDLINCSNFYTEDNRKLKQHIKDNEGLIAIVEAKEADSNVLFDIVTELKTDLDRVTYEATTSLKNRNKFTKLLEYKENLLTEIKQDYIDNSNTLSAKNATFVEKKGINETLEKGISDLTILNTNLAEQELILRSDIVSTTADIEILTNQYDVAKKLNNGLTITYNTITSALSREEQEFKETQKNFPFTSCKAYVQPAPLERTCAEGVSTLNSNIDALEAKIESLEPELETCEIETEKLKTESFSIYPFYAKVRLDGCSGGVPVPTEDCSTTCVREIKRVLDVDIDDVSKSMAFLDDKKGVCECRLVGYKPHVHQTARNNEAVLKSNVAGDVLFISAIVNKDGTGSTYWTGDSGNYNVTRVGYGICITYKNMQFNVHDACGDVPNWILFGSDGGKVMRTCPTETIIQAGRVMWQALSQTGTQPHLAMPYIINEVNNIYNRIVTVLGLQGNADIEKAKNDILEEARLKLSPAPPPAVAAPRPAVAAPPPAVAAPPPLPGGRRR
jgi:hypothetical protein